NAPPPAGLKYYAPAGSRVISALSTLIQAKIEQEIAEALANNQPVPSLKKLKAEAIADVADDLDLDGVNLLSYDPVALKNNERLSDNVRLTAAKVHVINQ